MTTADIPKTIGASIHQEALSRVSSFFNATSHEILNELLQNCRRAGATKVEISTDSGLTTVADNGKGIENPLALLSFGLTGWNEETAKAEHAAGMGLYTLARRGLVKIRSRSPGMNGWEVTLLPQHFTGEDEATVTQTGFEHPTGTAVTFSGPAPSCNELERATKYYPLPVMVNGQPQERRDYLEQAVVSDQFRGIELGVFRGHHSGGLNFHGIVVERAHMPVVFDLENTWYTAGDVKNAEGLELTLPARKEVVETAFTAEMRAAALVTAYRGMLQGNPHPDVSHTTQTEAAKAGFQIPDARPRLRPWEPADAKSNTDGSQQSRTEAGLDALVMTAELTAPDQQALARAAERSGLLPFIMEADPRMAGYSWYEKLEKITAMETTIFQGDSTFTLSDLRQENRETDTEMVDRIEIELTMSTGTDGHRIVVLPADLAFAKAECEYWDQGEGYISKDNTLDPEQLRHLFMEAYFDPSNDTEAGSWETQEEDCSSNFEMKANRLLKGSEAAAKASIAKAAQRHMAWNVPEDNTVTVTMRKGKPPEVTFTPDAAG